MKVLVVEYDQIGAERLQSIIEPFGHEVLCAGSGKVAYQTAVTERPEMAVINTVLPDMRGMELFYRIRNHPLLRDMIVILANPNPSDNEVLEGFCLHSDFHWQRPLDAADLRKVMRLLSQNGGDTSRRFQDRDFAGSWPNTFTRQPNK